MTAPPNTGHGLHWHHVPPTVPAGMNAQTVAGSAPLQYYPGYAPAPSMATGQHFNYVSGPIAPPLPHQPYINPQDSRRRKEDEPARKKARIGQPLFSNTRNMVKLTVKKALEPKQTPDLEETSDSETAISLYMFTDSGEVISDEEVISDLASIRRRAATLKRAIVDEETVEELVHKEVACHRSPVLRAAFNSPCVEGQSQSFPLVGATQRTAQLLVQWLYMQKLVIPRLDDGWVEDHRKMDEEAEEDCDLMRLWILADFLKMPALQNDTIDAINEIYNKTNYLPTSCYDDDEGGLYELTAEDSKLRQFYCRQFVVGVKLNKHNRHYLHNLPSDMLEDIICLQGEGVKYKDPLNIEDFYVVEQTN